MDHNCAALEAPGFSLSACRFCSNPDKAGAGRRAIGDMSRAAHIKRHGAKDDAADADEDKSSPAMCYTLEMSFYNAPSRSRQWSTSTSNEESYERHGVGLAHAFVDYYRLRPPTEQRVEGILRRVDASAKVSRGSDQAAAWTKGDLMFGFGTQIFADGGGAHKPWHKNGAKEARAALNAREPSVSAMDRSTRGDDAEERRLVVAVAAGASERVENPGWRQIPVENGGEGALLGEEGDVLRG